MSFDNPHPVQVSGRDGERPVIPVIDEWVFCRTSEYVPGARHRVGLLAEKLLGCSGRAADVELAAGEVLANAVVHGAGQQALVRVRADDGLLRVEVHDAGMGPIVEPGGDPMAESGRGLLLVAALTSRYGIAVSADGTCAWFEADL